MTVWGEDKNDIIVTETADENTLQVDGKAFDYIDSTEKATDLVKTDTQETSTSKSGSKRSGESIEDWSCSTTKPPKLACVKIELSEWLHLLCWFEFQFVVF